MADDIDMLDDMEFETQLTAMGDDQPELLKFVARQTFTTSKVLVNHGKRIKSLEKTNKKTFGIIGAVSAVLATAVVATMDYLLKR